MMSISCTPTVASLESIGAATMGGLILGLVSMTRLRMTGEVLGISGIVGRLTMRQLQLDTALDSASFIFGTVTAGMILKALLPAAFGPAWVGPILGLSALRIGLAGILVGAGTAMSNGCTSGHGILGNARFSIRSMVSTIIFMVSGIATATLFSTASWRATISSADKFQPWPLSLQTSFLLASALALSYGIAIKLTFTIHHKKVIRRTIDFFSGTSFGLGLGIAGMANSLRVASFLDLAAFDPTLMFVMCGAIGVAAPLFIFWGGSTPTVKPTLADKYCLAPRDKPIDNKLVLGSLMFGCGWGLAGWCPGPAILGLGALSGVGIIGPSLLFNSAMFAGWTFYYRLFA